MPTTRKFKVTRKLKRKSARRWPTASGCQWCPHSVKYGDVRRELKEYKINRDDEWLWCMCCERVFQVKDLRLEKSFWLTVTRCPFGKCMGMGMGFELFKWDEYSGKEEVKIAGNGAMIMAGDGSGKSHWPDNVSKLKKGMRIPLYPKKRTTKKRG